MDYLTEGEANNHASGNWGGFGDLGLGGDKGDSILTQEGSFHQYGEDSGRLREVMLRSKGGLIPVRKLSVVWIGLSSERVGHGKATGLSAGGKK